MPVHLADGPAAVTTGVLRPMQTLARLPPRQAAALALRLACAGLLLLALLVAARSPLMPPWLTVLAMAIVAAAAWRPAATLPWVIAAAPFGELTAAVPIRATETILAAFFAGWLLRVPEPVDPEHRVPRFVAVPALAFAVLAVVSWIRILLERWAGSASSFAAQFTRMPEYLVTAGHDPPTAAMLRLLLMVAVCLSVPALSSRTVRLPSQVALAVTGAGVLAATTTVGVIALGYLQTGDADLITRYLGFRTWRYSLHLTDLNAAGSHYALAALTALAFARTRGVLSLAWSAGLLSIVAALWMTGSRVALLASVVGAGGWIALISWHPQGAEGTGAWPGGRSTALAAIVLCGALLLATTAWMVRAGSQSDDPGISFRQGFFVTSVRMISSAPAFGVGVGMYYERSPEFMPPVVLNPYPGGENAHNYFAQATAELGIIGGALFLWWLGAILAGMWRTARRGPTRPLGAALLAACVAYLATCLVGHPLLVVEATVPFWAAAGAGLALSPPDSIARARRSGGRNVEA